jgi:hypothetical protein
MAALKLVSLVLRGVAVRCDRVNVNLRLGSGYEASLETPEIPFSMRHPSQGITQEPFGNPAGRLDHILDVDDADSGAGRSLGLAGVLSRSTLISGMRRTARMWSGTNGGTVSTTAARTSLATPAAAAGISARCKPATRTPPASTWGRGIR